MEHGSETEFQFIIIGGIALATVMVAIPLIAFGILIYKKLKDNKIIEKIYEQKRENGKHGGGNNF
jgi:hypothetical protein